jgi:hypothetical protein
MEFDVVDVITKLGLPIALVVYYLWKDYKMMDRLIQLMQQVTDLLEDVEAHLKGLEDKEV